LEFDDRAKFAKEDSQSNANFGSATAILDGTHTPHDFVSTSDGPERKNWWSIKLKRSSVNTLVTLYD